ncbi:hypothetical protein EVAR_23774_1 [Eumeta japonica]|uniref:Uncharacterized protein n=1 Tax=Eumeta variegata TaxID=151549 RepID=A0A4C1VIK3_EUMVA|nr:hypothetical protein EVAR_23774_1 [Eumeta japonica]
MLCGRLTCAANCRLDDCQTVGFNHQLPQESSQSQVYWGESTRIDTGQSLYVSCRHMVHHDHVVMRRMCGTAFCCCFLLLLLETVCSNTRSIRVFCLRFAVALQRPPLGPSNDRAMRGMFNLRVVVGAPLAPVRRASAGRATLEHARPQRAGGTARD